MTNDALDSLILEERKLLLFRALFKLPFRWRHSLMRKFWHGKFLKDIAIELPLLDGGWNVGREQVRQ